MFTGRILIPRYVVKGALPYTVLSLVLLTAILFTQQSGRFAELALYADLPLSLAAEIASALLPSVLILTLPVAVLAGIVIVLAITAWITAVQRILFVRSLTTTEEIPRIHVVGDSSSPVGQQATRRAHS